MFRPTNALRSGLVSTMLNRKTSVEHPGDRRRRAKTGMCAEHAACCTRASTIFRDSGLTMTLTPKYPTQIRVREVGEL